MNLSEYLRVETGVDLAARLNVPPALLSQWRTGVRPVPIKRCTEIERSTGGAVTRRDLRPYDWAEIWPELADDANQATVEDAAGAHHKQPSSSQHPLRRVSSADARTHRVGRHFFEVSKGIKKGKKPIEQIPLKVDHARAAEDIATELHNLSNQLYRAGDDRLGEAADIAAGFVEVIAGEIRS